MWRGAMSFETPMLFALGFIVPSAWLASPAWCCRRGGGRPVPPQLFRRRPLPLRPSSPAASWGDDRVLLAAQNGPGHMYSETLGKWHLADRGVLQPDLHAPVLPRSGWHAPAHSPDYALQFAEFNAISTVGAFIPRLFPTALRLQHLALRQGRRKARTRCGRAPRASNGSCRPRRPTIAGKPSRRSVAWPILPSPRGSWRGAGLRPPSRLAAGSGGPGALPDRPVHQALTMDPPTPPLRWPWPPCRPAGARGCRRLCLRLRPGAALQRALRSHRLNGKTGDKKVIRDGIGVGGLAAASRRRRASTRRAR